MVHDWSQTKNWKKILTKLHENFGHPKNYRLKELLVGGRKWQEDMAEIIEEISKECQAEVCLQDSTKW
jgi:hypothetical protein